MYSFCVEKNGVPLVKVMVVNEIVEKDSYFKSLVEKCFERVFSMIKEDSSEEADLEDDED